MAHEQWSVTDPGLDNHDARLAMVAGGTQGVAETLAAKLARRRAEREADRQPMPWWHDRDGASDHDEPWAQDQPMPYEGLSLEDAELEDAELEHVEDEPHAELGYHERFEDDDELEDDGHLARAEAYERWARGLEESSPEPAARPMPAVPSVPTRGRHGRRRSKPQRRSTHRVAWAAVVAGALVLALLVVFVLSGGDATAPDEPAVSRKATDSAVAFVMDEVDRGASVVADQPTRSALVRAGFPAASVSTYDNPAGDPSVIVVTSALRADRDSAAAALLARSVPLAQFGGALEVRQVLPTSLSSAAVLADRESRRGAGAALVTDNRLRLTPDAWAALTDGAADPRVLSALSILVAKHLLDVASIGGSSGSTDAGPARSLEITAVDGVPVSADSPGLKDAVATLRAQPAPYRPQRTEVVRVGGVPTLHIHFLAPSPLALPNA